MLSMMMIPFSAAGIGSLCPASQYFIVRCDTPMIFASSPWVTAVSEMKFSKCFDRSDLCTFEVFLISA